MLSKDKTTTFETPVTYFHDYISWGVKLQTQWSHLNDVNFFLKKKITKEKYWKQHSEIIDFKTFESIPLEPIATLTADLKPNLWQTPVGNFRINGLGLTQTKRKNIYRKCFFNQVVSCCVFVLPHALSKYYLMKMKVSRSLHFS